jgi:hypothetical protein
VRVLYLTRGRGYSHALADVNIITSLKRLDPELELVHASYDLGLKTLRRHGFQPIDLALTLDDELDARKYAAAVLRAIRVADPDVIVANEVFWAPAIAQRLEIPCVLLTHWFFENVFGATQRALARDRQLAAATRLVMLDFEQFHPVPESFSGSVSFVGAVRPIRNNGDGRECAATFDWLAGREFGLIVAGGGDYQYWPLLERTVDEFRSHPDVWPTPAMVFVVPEQAERFARLVDTNGITDRARCVGYIADPMPLMTAASLVISRGSFSSMSELAAMGKPSLQILDQQNPIDRYHAERFSELGTIRTAELDETPSGSFASSMTAAYRWGRESAREIRDAGSVYQIGDGPDKAAVEILDVCHRDSRTWPTAS